MKLVSAFLIVVFGLCSTGSAYTQGPQGKAKQKKQIPANKYACPMKCEGDKTYAKMGKCPECGMTLKEVKQSKDSTRLQ